MELIIKIFSYLNDSDRKNLSITCKFLRNIHKNFVGYRYYVFEPPNDVPKKFKKFTKNPITKPDEIPFIYCVKSESTKYVVF